MDKSGAELDITAEFGNFPLTVPTFLDIHVQNYSQKYCEEQILTKNLNLLNIVTSINLRRLFDNKLTQAFGLVPSKSPS